MAGYLFDSCTQYTVQAFVCTSLTRWTWKPKASLDWKWLLNEDQFEFEFMVCLTQELGNINRPDSFLSLNSFCWFCLFFISCTAVSNISSTLQQNIWYLHSPLSLSGQWAVKQQRQQQRVYIDTDSTLFLYIPPLYGSHVSIGWGGRRRVDGYMAIVPTHQPVMTWIQGVPGVTRSKEGPLWCLKTDFADRRIECHDLASILALDTGLFAGELCILSCFLAQLSPPLI